MSSSLSSRLSSLFTRSFHARTSCLIAALAEFTNSLSINLNATSPSLQVTVGPNSTLIPPNVSMCAVEQNGLSPIADGPPVPADYSTACSCSDLIHSFASEVASPYLDRNSRNDTFTAFATLTTIANAQYIPPRDCCVQCWVTARDVQVFYWPENPDTKRPANVSVPITITTPQSIISNDITFISPSVYVAYRNLRRSDDCPSFGWGDFTRGRVYNTTIAYKPGFLSTSLCTGQPQGGYRGFAALNVTELQYPTSYNGTCMGLNVELEKTTNGPYLSIPPDLTALDPDWSTCDAVYWGAFDPPIALHTATALAPDPGSKSPPTPAPGSPIAPPHAPATPTPFVNPVEPERHSPAPNAASQDPKQQNPNSPNPVKAPATPNPTSLIIDPASDNSGNPIACTALADPRGGGEVAQGNSKATSDPQSGDPQQGSEVSEGDSGVDLGNGHNAESSSNPANKDDQSPVDPAQPLPSIGGHQIQAAKGGGVIVASTTLQPGLQTTIDGTMLSVDKDHVMLASSTISLASPPADPIITLINGDTLSAGGQAAIVSGTTVALAANDALVVNGKTSPLPPPPTPILTVAGQTLTPSPAGFAIGGHSVLPGGPAVTVDGSTFSLASESNAFIVNGKTSPLQSVPATPIITLAGQEITPAPTGFAIGGSSVLPGGPAVTLDGSTFSLASSGGSNALIVNGKTTPLPSTPLSAFTVGSQIFTAAPTGFKIGTQSVSRGAPAVMVDGTLISMDSSQLIIGTSTVPLGSGAQTQDGALRSLIFYGGGGGANATIGSSNASGVAPFLGGSGRLSVGIGTVVFALVVNLGTAGIFLGLV